MFAFKEEDLTLTAPWPAGRRVTQRETLRAQEKLSSVASIQKKLPSLHPSSAPQISWSMVNGN